MSLTVICYLALFRLDELGMAHYRRFVRAQDTNKMHKVSALGFTNVFLPFLTLNQKENTIKWTAVVHDKNSRK